MEHDGPPRSSISKLFSDMKRGELEPTGAQTATCFYHELAKHAENWSTWCHMSSTIGSGEVESMASSKVELFSTPQVRFILER